MITSINEFKKINESFSGKIIATDKSHLKILISKNIEKFGTNVDLNYIDTCKIIDMTGLFENSDFNGDISQWNVSNVTNMTCMFFNSKFNQDISNWDVSNVNNMSSMFEHSDFNGDISEWNVANVKYISFMFEESELKKNNNLPKWYQKD